MNANADALQGFLRDNRVADVMMLRRTEQLGPIVDSLDYGPLTFLAYGPPILRGVMQSVCAA
ncbi:hypothetical protein ACFYUD_07440 [Nocardia tengchongensis]|uniref:hypothetical protein n=1 Tax=Nocardia tengchongensis TaxID=2055889 RepID=UPI00368A4874